MRSEAEYWATAAEPAPQMDRHVLWRAHSDAINKELLATWLPGEPVERLLKTDLFDEASWQGLYPLLASRAQVSIGMDLSVSIVRAAQSRHPGLRATNGDVRCLPFADNVFGTVVSNSTLDHFQSWSELVASLRELHRVLRVGGHLLLTLDNLANPAVALRNALPFSLLNRLGIVPYYVGATCGPGRLRRMLQQLQFEVQEFKAAMHCPRIAAVALSALLQKHAGPETQSRFLRFLSAFEVLSRWPTRYLTGYFVAAKAIKL